MLLCRNYFTDPADVDEGLALLARAVTATGLGIAVSALVTPPAAARFGPWRWIGWCIAAAAVIEGLFVIHVGIAALFFGTFALGLTGQAAKICVDAVVQDTVDDGFRGRVFSFYDVVFNAAFVAAAGLSVLLLPADGYSRPVFAGVSVLFLGGAVSYLIAERRQELTAQTAEPVGSALDLEDEAGLATEVDPGTRGDHGGYSRLDRHR
jgi:MFS family permease